MIGAALAVTLSAGLGVTTTQAAPILIDVGDRINVATGNTPTLGGTWNVLTVSAVTPPDIFTSPVALVDVNNNATGITIQNTGMFELVDNATAPNPTGAWTGGDVDWVDGDATGDFFATPAGGTSTITLAGLNPEGRYQIDVVSARLNNSTNRVADYLVQGVFADTTPNGDDFNANVDGWVGNNILSWYSVTPTAAGNITLTLQPNSGDFYGYLNAIRIQQVPEPASISNVLVCLLALALVAWGRRKVTQ